MTYDVFRKTIARKLCQQPTAFNKMDSDAGTPYKCRKSSIKAVKIPASAFAAAISFAKQLHVHTGSGKL